MKPITATCSTKYHAVHDSGSRPKEAVIWVVIHTTEGDTAEGAAVWFTNPASKGSTHLIVDNDECFRTLPNSAIPWGAEGANYCGFHIEQAGHASWSRATWLKHDNTIRRAAFKTALHANLFGIPLRWVGPTSLRLKRKGVTTHADCTKAFGGNHTDPGAGYPKDVFLRYAKEYLGELNV